MKLLRKRRGFGVPAVAGLALAIGAATAVFSVFSAMLLRSMGFDDPRRIVAVWSTDEHHAQKHVEVCYDDLLASLPGAICRAPTPRERPAWRSSTKRPPDATGPPEKPSANGFVSVRIRKPRG
jgi:hypothetical protein